ncbi:hypothetical protein A4S02_00150 [Acetobacter ascendens]|uniref:Response regulatory domain-containing protein n=2 Tax=Acetobacter ascendens TaxID=481146 RepID=A0A1D8QSW7_9PROT|nr:response regulator [Acetobacter ascendens]AOW45425.1 hypothetical protein A4S02_00150 [Acetobacter ascendens]
MRELLERCGFNVRDFESGQECLDCLNIACPDLLLLDLTMPEMDGRELALRIRQTSTAHIPIMFLTGNLVESANRHVASLEDCPVIGKPVNLSILIQEIGKILSLTWVFPHSEITSQPEQAKLQEPVSHLLEQDRLYLLAALNGGNLKQLREKLASLQSEKPMLQDILAPLVKMAATYQLEALRIQLEQDEA